MMLARPVGSKSQKKRKNGVNNNVSTMHQYKSQNTVDNVGEDHLGREQQDSPNILVRDSKKVKTKSLDTLQAQQKFDAKDNRSSKIAVTTSIQKPKKAIKTDNYKSQNQNQHHEHQDEYDEDSSENEMPYSEEREPDSSEASQIMNFEKRNRIQQRIDLKSHNLMASLPRQYKNSDTLKQKVEDSSQQSYIIQKSSISNLQKNDDAPKSDVVSHSASHNTPAIKDVFKGFPSKRQMALDNVKRKEQSDNKSFSRLQLDKQSSSNSYNQQQNNNSRKSLQDPAKQQQTKLRSAEQLFMSDTTVKKQRALSRKLKQQEERMAEIKEIEQLHTISEDELTEQPNKKKKDAQKQLKKDNDVVEDDDKPRDQQLMTPDLAALLPQQIALQQQNQHQRQQNFVKGGNHEKRISSAIVNSGATGSPMVDHPSQEAVAADRRRDDGGCDTNEINDVTDFDAGNGKETPLGVDKPPKLSHQFQYNNKPSTSNPADTHHHQQHLAAVARAFNSEDSYQIANMSDEDDLDLQPIIGGSSRIQSNHQPQQNPHNNQTASQHQQYHVKKQVLRSAHPTHKGGGKPRQQFSSGNNMPIDLSQKNGGGGGVSSHQLEFNNQSQMSSNDEMGRQSINGGVASRGSQLPPASSNLHKVKFVNLQALIDKEIIIDQMLQNFGKGESITELSIQLWYLICDIDIAATQAANSQGQQEQPQQIPDRMQDLKEWDKQSLLSMVSVLDNYNNPYDEYLPDRRFKRQVAISIKLQMIVSRLSGFFDEVLVLENMRHRNDVSPMFKNMLEYVYKSHIVLCAVVLQKVPEATKQQNKWANFLKEILEVNLGGQAQMKQVSQDCSQIMQQNNNNLSAVIKRLLNFATHRTGTFETINLIMTHLSRVSLVTMKDLLLQHSLEDGFNHINKKLVDFLREPEKSLPEIVGTNDIRSIMQYPLNLNSNAGSAAVGNRSDATSPTSQYMRQKATRGAQQRSQKRSTTFDTSLTSAGLAQNEAATAKTQQMATHNHKQLTALQRQLQLLPMVRNPYLPPMNSNSTQQKDESPSTHLGKPSADGRFGSERKYTLVLDLDETLIHYVDNGDTEESYFLIRPFCQQFLREMAQFYEVVIFTAGVQEYADWVVDQLDPKRELISHRLYRQHTINRSKTNPYPMIIKDLSKIGRSLHKTIIVDNIAENFLLQKDSGIFIKTWTSDQNDTQLRDLIPLLKEIVVREVKDVRVSLRKFRDQLARMILQGSIDTTNNDSVKPQNLIQ